MVRSGCSKRSGLYVGNDGMASGIGLRGGVGGGSGAGIGFSDGGRGREGGEGDGVEIWVKLASGTRRGICRCRACAAIDMLSGCFC
jgi:hypothetical protein